MPDDTTAPVTAEDTAPSDLPASPTAGSNDLRERYAAAAAEWALMYPISSWALADGEKAVRLAKVWGEQIARFLDEAVRDKEVEQLRAELDRLKFAAKTITENDWYGRLARAEAELERIRHAITDTYGEDYAGKNVAAETERLFRHLAEFETNMGQVLGARSEALERAQAERDALKSAIEKGEVARFAADVLSLVDDYSDREQSVIARLPFLATFDQVCFEKYGLNTDQLAALAVPESNEDAPKEAGQRCSLTDANCGWPGECHVCETTPDAPTEETDG